MNKRIIFKTIYILLVCMLVSSIALSSSSVQVNEEYLHGMLDFIDLMYANSAGIDGLMGASLNGAMEGMSEYSCFELSSGETDAGYAGIGANLEKVRSGFRIVSVLPSSPAFEAGLNTGDVLIRVDKQNTAVMGIDTFRMYMARYDSALFEVIDAETGLTSVIRIESYADYKKDVDYVVLDNAGYIRLNSLSEETSGIIEGILSSLKTMGRENIILDLRDFSYMNVADACAVADLFMEGGRIASSKLGFYNASGKTVDFNISILVNGNTSGAGEIIAAAVPAVIYGETTAGMAWDIQRYPVFTSTAYEYYKEVAGSENIRSILHHLDFMDMKTAPLSIAGYLNLVESKVSDSSGRIISSENRIEPDVFVEDTTLWHADYEPEGDRIKIRRDYQYGSVNYDVFIAKKILRNLGIFDGPMNVVFGESMTAAVNEYKQGIGYPADGVLDKSTQAMLNTYTMQEAVGNDVCVKVALGDFQ